MTFRFGLLGALLALGACNAFNPSGKGDPSSDQEWIEQGEAQLRDADFVAAKESFGHVLARDSGNADAWSGYVKATSGLSLDNGLLLKEALASEREHRKFLWDIPLERKDSIYRSIRPVWEAFETWARLERQGRTVMPPVRRTERGLVLLTHSMLSMWDSNRDDRITTSGDALAIRLFGSLESQDTTGLGFKPDVSSDEFVRLLANGSPDPTGGVDSTKIDEFNTFIQSLDEEFGTITGLAQEDTSLKAIASGVSDQNPEALGIYKISNVSDDDLDGCADEEILDGFDNDGDGLIDEDTRAGYVVPTARDSGDLAQISQNDHVRGDRLASPSSGRGLFGQDSSATLLYGDSRGHFEIFRPLWDPRDPRYASLRWKYTCPWSATEAAQLGVACSDGAIMDPVTRIALNKTIESASPGRSRAEVGCVLLGGCWCKILADLCTTPAGCDDP